MTTPPEMGRKVRQLDNDVQSIYDLLTDLDVGVKKVHAGQLRQGSRLDQIEDRLTGVEDRLTGVDGKLDSVLDLLRRDQPTEN